MERAVALKKLTSLLGKKLGYQINAKAPSPEERAAAVAEMPEAVAERSRLEKLKNERYRAVLAADAEYQKLSADYKAAKERADRLFSIKMTHKITVGTDEGFFFMVKASGDSWEEVIAKLTAKTA